MVIHLKHRHKAYFIQSLSFFPLMIYLFSSCAAAPEISGCLSNCLSETLARLIHSSYRRAERKLPSAFNSLNWITVLHKHLSRLECTTRFNKKKRKKIVVVQLVHAGSERCDPTILECSCYSQLNRLKWVSFVVTAMEVQIVLIHFLKPLYRLLQGSCKV